MLLLLASLAPWVVVATNLSNPGWLMVLTLLALGNVLAAAFAILVIYKTN